MGQMSFPVSISTAGVVCVYGARLAHHHDEKNTCVSVRAHRQEERERYILRYYSESANCVCVSVFA